MRFGALSALAVLGASLAASASPIRVVVTEVSSVRYGHAAGDPSNHVAHLAHPPVDTLFAASAFAQPVIPTPDGQGDKPHHGSGRHFCQSMRAKAVDASNALRQWFGFEPILIEVNAGQRRPQHMHHMHHMDRPPSERVSTNDGNNKDHNLPILPFVGTPVRPAFAEGEGGWVDNPRGGPGRRPMWIHRHGGPHRFHGSFLRRVHHALMTLGPWEGRAVAFVLGCGIGVLLRMVWVMVLVTARAFRGSRDNEENEYDDVVFDEAEAEMLVPPPQYTIIEGSEAVPVPVHVPVDEKAEKA